ncbi:unnamed protein product, partial [Brenthis ino]
MMYVPPSPQPEKENNLDINVDFPALSSNPEPATVMNQPQSYSEVVKSAKKINSVENKNKRTKCKKKNISKKKNSQSRNTMDWDISSDSEVNIEVASNYSKEEQKNNSDHISFKQLLENLKNIIFIRRISLKEKITEALAIIWEWLISLCKTKVLELPIFKNIFESVDG